MSHTDTIQLRMTQPVPPEYRQTLPAWLHDGKRIAPTVIQWCVSQLTPEMSAELCRHAHPDNRNLSKSHIRNLRKSIEAGEWKHMGQAFAVFNADAVLINGHHSCEAHSQTQHILRDVVIVQLFDSSAVAYLDTAIKKRTSADILRMHGRGKLHNVVISAIALESVNFNPEAGKQSSKRSPLLDAKAVLACEHTDTLQELYSMSRRGVPVRSGALGGMLRCLKASPDAVVFFTAVLRNDPTIGLHANALSSFLVSYASRTSRSNIVTHRRQAMEAAIVIKVWNAWRRREPLGRMLRFTLERDIFPDALP